MRRRLSFFFFMMLAATSAHAQSLLRPPEAALRVADRAKLTGIELGTMWTSENPPLDYWKKTYNFTPSKEWMDHIRLSSVRYADYCSASFVSPNGLVITNHHCGRECVEANSRDGTDYVVKGFYAKSREEEKLCPQLFLDQLVDVQNVTAQVEAASKATSDTAMARKRAAAIEKIQSDCTATSKLTCQAVTLYNGGQYQLYKYKRYTTVKLVFAPELQAGFFGGDPDNFTYPRYDLDFSVVRAYEGNTPASTPHYFQWRADAPKEGDLVFVTGNPGSTSRQITVSAVMYEKEFRHPFLIQFLGAQRDLMQRIAAMGPQQEQAVREQLFEISNSLKAYEGEYAGLQDTLLLGQKIRWERELRNRINANAQYKAKFGDVWDKIAAIQLQKMQISPRLNITNAGWLGAPTLLFATSLVQAGRAEPMDLPPTIVSEGLLNAHVDLATRWLPAGDPLIGLFKDVKNSKILDPAFRAQLEKGGSAAIKASTDPAIKLARAMLAGREALQQRWDNLQASEAAQQARLAQAGFAAFGTNIPPDATFTFRISDGVVKGYEYNGTLAPAFTTFYGVYGRAAEFQNKDPFTLPAQYEANKANVNMATVLDFVSTNDITGGNSGSPVVDREGRIVGLAFDGNIESLPNEFLYRNISGRSVSVSTAGVSEALRNIYHADALLKELMGMK